MLYTITFKDFSQWSVTADTLHEPDDRASASKFTFYVLELDGEVVAKYRASEVIGWLKITSPMPV